jgi:hypothetical protein
MKFKIGEKEYDAESGVAKASLTTVYELKKEYGIGMKQVMASAQKFQTFEDASDILERMRPLSLRSGS